MDSLNLKPFKPSENTLDHVKRYLQTWMVELNKEIYIAPYVDG